MPEDPKHDIAGELRAYADSIGAGIEPVAGKVIRESRVPVDEFVETFSDPLVVLDGDGDGHDEVGVGSRSQPASAISRRWLLVAAAIVVVVLTTATMFAVRTHDGRLDTVQQPAFPVGVGTWTSAPEQSLAGRTLNEQANAAWTGMDVIILGGFVQQVDLGSGADRQTHNLVRESPVYNPSTNTWRTIPSPPIDIDATRTMWFWDGRDVVLIGAVGPLDDPGAFGGRFVQAQTFAIDPRGGDWRRLADPPSDVGTITTAAWTGSMVVATTSQGFLTYHPDRDSWDALVSASGLSTSPAKGPVWTGREMVDVGASVTTAFEPVSRTLRTLPAAPFGPGVVAAGGTTAIAFDPFEGTTATLDTTNPDSTWQTVPTPTPRLKPMDARSFAAWPQAFFAWGSGPVATLDLGTRSWSFLPAWPGDEQELTGAGVWAGDRLFTWWPQSKAGPGSGILRGAVWKPGTGSGPVVARTSGTSPGSSVPLPAGGSTLPLTRIFDGLTGDGIRLTVSVGDVAYQGTCNCSVTAAGASIDYRLTDGTSGTIVVPVKPFTSTGDLHPEESFTMGADNQHVPTFAVVQTSDRVATLRMTYQSGEVDERTRTTVVAVFASAPGDAMTKIEALDAGGQLLAACVPVPGATGCA